MVERAQVVGMISAIQKVLEEPVPTYKDAFGAVHLVDGAFRVANTLHGAKTILEGVLLDGISEEEVRPEKPAQGIIGPYE